MNTHEQLLNEIETFIAEADMPASEFGRLSLNDTAFVQRLREGADVRLSTVDRIRDFILAHKRKASAVQQKKRRVA